MLTRSIFRSNREIIQIQLLNFLQKRSTCESYQDRKNCLKQKYGLVRVFRKFPLEFDRIFTTLQTIPFQAR